MKEYPHLNDLYISQRLRKRLSNIGKSRITTVTAERPACPPSCNSVPHLQKSIRYDKIKAALR